MIEIETVFILGAGSSHPYGYPTGKELRTYICDDFAGEIDGVFNRSGIEGRIAASTYQVDDFSKAFKNSNTRTIDLFLSRNQNYSEIGRLAIVLSLLRSERESTFGGGIKSPDQDWYDLLFHMMTHTLNRSDSYKSFEQNKVTFITFNYDRSLEHFLYMSLKTLSVKRKMLRLFPR